MWPDDDLPNVPVPPSPVARTVAYLQGAYTGLVAGIESRTEAHTGLHVKVTRTGGPGRIDWPFVASQITLDVSHEDAVEAEAAAERVLSLIDQWPWVDPDVYREPHQDGATPVWNPLDDPRIPAYTFTFTVTFAA